MQYIEHVQHAVIGAAGLGSRLGMDMPKALVPIGRKTIIQYQLELLESIRDVRIVVGFKELDVIEHVRHLRPDATFVRNPDYLATSCVYSIHLATRDLTTPYMMLDGDLVIDPNEFSAFLDACNEHDTLIGITPSKTEDAVFVELDDTGTSITGFQREQTQPYEWPGIAYFRDFHMRADARFVFEELVPQLPLAAKAVQCYEIDTERDLQEAIEHFDDLGYESP